MSKDTIAQGNEATAHTSEIESRARRIRGIGYAICGILALALAAFLLYHVVAGIDAGTIYDPQTGEAVKL